MKKTKKIVEVVDDFDGTPADQTVRFAFNGASYEIDLSREHFEEFAEAIQPYIKAGRKVGSTRRRGNAGNPTQRLENAKIRAWAKEEGHDLSD
ncbi:MAG: Lsr2 family protein, partial [Thermobifida sp.]|nr:Lsr2 family protein [Thermobifida sp.]